MSEKSTGSFDLAKVVASNQMISFKSHIPDNPLKYLEEYSKANG